MHDGQSHDHHAGHHHHHHHGATVAEGQERRLRLVLGVTLGFMLIEAVGGWLAGSLALLADAGHMLTDAGALLLALAGLRLGQRAGDARRTYGYRRFEVLAAFVNALVLLALTVWIVVEAALRLAEPEPVAAWTMLGVALAGLGANAVSLFILHRDPHQGVNLRGAMLHVLSDLLGSVGAVLAAIVILLTDWTPIDPILSVVLSLLILRSALKLLRQTTHILLEGTPEDLDRDTVLSAVKAQPGVADAHHLHLWSLSSGQALATLHIVPRDAADGAAVVRRVKALLKQDFSIEHATVEIDLDGCADEPC